MWNRGEGRRGPGIFPGTGSALAYKKGRKMHGRQVQKGRGRGATRSGRPTDAYGKVSGTVLERDTGGTTLPVGLKSQTRLKDV